MSILDADYWTQRYAQQETGWDTGLATPPITEFFEKVANKDARILVPGAGNGHESEWLFKQGFKHVYTCDWSALPLQQLQARVPDMPAAQLLQADFFKLELEPFDYIVEQTFFCAIDRALRPQYAAKTASLLKPGGQLVGVLFGVEFPFDGPPFGGDIDEYLAYFEPYFSAIKIEPCRNSIKPRQGNELFVHMRK
jgi:thiopurine S-methyltransferase